jgi:hypothetical protein
MHTYSKHKIFKIAYEIIISMHVYIHTYIHTYTIHALTLSPAMSSADVSFLYVNIHHKIIFTDTDSYLPTYIHTYILCVNSHSQVTCTECS